MPSPVCPDYIKDIVTDAEDDVGSETIVWRGVLGHGTL